MYSNFIAIFTSTATSNKKEAKKENKKMSTFAVAKIGMKLKEKAQKTQKNSLQSPFSTKEPVISTKNGIDPNNEMITTPNTGAPEAMNNSAPVSVNSSIVSPLLKNPTTTNPAGKKYVQCMWH